PPMTNASDNQPGDVAAPADAGHAEDLRRSAEALQRRGDTAAADQTRAEADKLDGTARACARCGGDISGEHANRRVCRDCQRPDSDKRRDAVAAAVGRVVAPGGEPVERLVFSMGDFLRYSPTLGYWRPVTADRVTADITAAGIDPADVATHADCVRAVAVAAVPPASPATAAEATAVWHLDTGEPAPPGAAWTGDVLGIDRTGDTPRLATSPVDPLVLRRQPPIPWTWSDSPPKPDTIARTWEFLVGLTGSPDMATALVADIGRMLAADWAEPAVVVLWGPAATGKSTAVELIAGLLLGPSAVTDDGTIAHAGYHAAASFADLGRRFGLAGLARWRLIAIDDLARLIERDADTDNGLAVVKSLADGRPVPVEAKNRDVVTVRGDCGIVIASNHRPTFARSTADADAWARRLRLYRCASPVASTDQHRGHGADLVRAEGEAFARYAVQIYADQIARSAYTDVPDAMAAQRQIATDEGLPPLQVWARGYTPGGWTATTDLEADAKDHLGEPTTGRKIGKALRDVHGAEAVNRQPRDGVSGFTVTGGRTLALE
ncbi:MAG: DUF5906 domain-containing protein, partial [Acidobacteria bacterium]|nr:DUF5906 domain-containing protein [Acidobacteriota bacterium]